MIEYDAKLSNIFSKFKSTIDSISALHRAMLSI